MAGVEKRVGQGTTARSHAPPTPKKHRHEKGLGKKEIVGLDPLRSQETQELLLPWGQTPGHWQADSQLASTRHKLFLTVSREALDSGLHGQTGLASHLLYQKLMVLPRLNLASDLLLAVTLSYHRGDPSALRIWADTLQVAAQHWTTSVLRVNTLRSSLQQLAQGAAYSDELLERSMLGDTSDALILGSLALSLQARITVYSETGELEGRYSPEVNLSVLRHLPKLHLIKLGEHTHGTWPTLPANDTAPSTALVESHPERGKLAAYWKHSSNLPTRIDFNGVQVGEWKDSDVKIASLNVDGLDGGKFEELLAYMDTQGLGVLVLQDTRCSQSQARYFGEQLKKRLGRQSKLFNVEEMAALNGKGEKKCAKVAPSKQRI